MSPIVAAILLVAITIVLSAVLYVLVSGMTSGSGNRVLGAMFGWGAVKNITAAPAPTGCAAAGKSCYSLEIASATGLTAHDIGFSLRTAAGSAAAIPPGASFRLVSASGNMLATWTSSGGWSAGGTTALAAGQTVVIGLMGGGLSRDSVLAVGQSAIQGAVPSGPLN